MFSFIKKTPPHAPLTKGRGLRGRVNCLYYNVHPFKKSSLLDPYNLILVFTNCDCIPFSIYFDTLKKLQKQNIMMD
jgi:hypothetical protein